MKVTYNWLKEYIKITLSPEKLGEKFTSLGIAVENITAAGSDITGVIVGKILKIEKHPNADKLVLCTVDTGAVKKLSIVCGAKNMKEGDKVPVAVDGAVLPGDFKITNRKVRDVFSEGMMCSGKELGILEDASGLLILPADAPLGKDITEYLKLKDWIFELEILPNRPDYLGALGVARMLSAAMKTPLKFPGVMIKEEKEKASDRAKVFIKAPELCPRYTARVITGVTIAPSPLWMQLRLKAVGVRPINNVVDITNYVLMETGHPLHAFDHRLIGASAVIVRRASEGEEMATLDGVKRKLTPENLVIADAEKAMAIAGIMGGQESEINPKTEDVLLESAYFDPVSIRKTSKYLNLSTEASFRFERGMDYEGLVFAQNRAASLIASLCGGKVLKGIIDVYPKKIKPAKVTTRFDRVRKLLGANIKDPEMLDIAKRLGFKILKKSKTGFTASVPSFRVELDREIDMIEEIAQVYGYEKIKERVPRAELFASVPQTRFEDALKRELTARGLYEAVNWGFMAKAWFDKAGIAGESVLRKAPALLNPLTDEWNVMRPSLLPGLLADTARNVVSFNNRNVKFFEIGNVFTDNSGTFEEHKDAGIIMTGSIGEECWTGKTQDTDFFYLKGLLESVFPALGIKYFFKAKDNELFERVASCVIILNGTEAGYFGELKKQIAKAFDIKQKVFYASVSLPELAKAADLNRCFTAIPKFPAVRRDISFVAAGSIASDMIKEFIEGMKNPLIEKVGLVYVFEGEQIGAGNRSLTYSLIYRDSNKTLTDKEVDGINNRITEEVSARFGVTVRK